MADTTCYHKASSIVLSSDILPRIFCLGRKAFRLAMGNWPMIFWSCHQMLFLQGTAVRSCTKCTSMSGKISTPTQYWRSLGGPAGNPFIILWKTGDTFHRWDAVMDTWQWCYQRLDRPHELFSGTCYLWIVQQMPSTQVVLHSLSHCLVLVASEYYNKMHSQRIKPLVNDRVYFNQA